MPDPTPHVDQSKVLAWRLNQHGLIERQQSQALVPTLERVCGIHAQLMSSAELSLWARLQGLNQSELSTLLWSTRTVVKFWAMRGTLHLIPSAEFGLWVAALSTYTNRGNKGHPEAEELTKAVERALQDGPVTREELAALVHRISGSRSLSDKVRLGWGSYLKPASFRGKLCFAQSKGRRVRFASPAKWLPGGFRKPRSAVALREVARRYLSAYGPATVEDLSRWWGAGIVQARKMMELLDNEVAVVRVEGERAWALKQDLSALLSMPPVKVAQLLPAFDPWIANGPRHCCPSLTSMKHRRHVYRDNGWLSPVMLLNGKIVGTWKHSSDKNRVKLRLRPFEGLPTWAVEQLESECRRLAAFLVRQIEIDWRDDTVTL